MPSSFLSHQAPALYLKLKYPRKIDGTAICLSTIVPDLHIFFDTFVPIPLRYISHSFLGLFLWTIPLTLFTSIMFSRYLAPGLAKLAKMENPVSKPLRYFGVDSWDYLRLKKFDKNFFIIGAYSALIGGLTHLLLDFPTHEYIELFYPLIIRSPDILLFPIFDFGFITTSSGIINLTLPVYRLLWLLFSLLLIFPTLYFLRKIRKDEEIEKWYSINKKNANYLENRN